MIVKSMNSKELMNEIAKDYPMVMRKATYLTENLRREAVKSKNKYVHRTYDYRTKRQNNWLIIINYYVNNPVFNIVVHYLDDFGFNGIVVEPNFQAFTHYTPHFLERYNERFLKESNISKKDLLTQFISKNAVGHAQYDINDDMTKRTFVRSREGVSLGYMEKLDGLQNVYTHYKTFISNSMILSHQQDTFDLTGQEYEKYWNETYSRTRIGAYNIAS